MNQETRKVTPLGNTVLVAPLKKSNRTTGGIFLADVDIMNSDPSEWVVLAVGPGKATRKGVWVKPEVEVGQRIIFNLRLQEGVKYVFEDGSKWAIVDASKIEMIF